MLEHEERGLHCLFKLRHTAKVKDLVVRMMRRGAAWQDCGDGWQIQSGGQRTVKVSVLHDKGDLIAATVLASVLRRKGSGRLVETFRRPAVSPFDTEKTLIAGIIADGEGVTIFANTQPAYLTTRTMPATTAASRKQANDLHADLFAFFFSRCR